MKINNKTVQGRERTRELVRIRDKRMCQDCRKKWIDGNRRFDIHHLNGLCGKRSRSYDKVSEMGGLITLCHKCHFNRPEHRQRNPLSGFKIYRKIEKSQHKNIFELRERGYTCAKIAKLYDVSGEIIRKISLNYRS